MYCNAREERWMEAASTGGEPGVSASASAGGASVTTSLSQGGITHAISVARAASQVYKARREAREVDGSSAKQTRHPSAEGST